MEQDCTIIALAEPKLIEDTSPTTIMEMGVYEFTGNIYFSEANQQHGCKFEAIKDVVPDIDKIHKNTTFKAKVEFENDTYSLLKIYFIETNP